MAVRRQEASKALKILKQFQADLPAEADPNLQAALGELCDVFHSRLFAALVDLQDMFHDQTSRDLRVAGNTSSEGNSPSVGRRKQELEWDEDHVHSPRPAGLGASEAPSSKAEGSVFEREVSSSSAGNRNLEEITVPIGNGGGLGMTIRGGVNKPKVPYDPSVFITKILPDGAAGVEGRLHVGDRILVANGVDLEGASQSDAAEALRISKTKPTLLVEHGALQRAQARSKHHEEVKIVKDNMGLGFSMAGGTKTPHVEGDTGVFITKIREGGATERDGRIEVGDRLVCVNDRPMVNLTHQEVVGYLRATDTHVSMVVEKGAFERAALEASSAFGLQNAPTPRFSRSGTLKRFTRKSRSDSLSSELPSSRSTPGLTPTPPPALPKGDSLALSPNRGPRVVSLSAGPKGFGLNIIGPSVSGEVPPGEPSGVFITRVVEGCAAAESGNVFIGDQILEVNGQNLRQANYSEAVEAIRRAGKQMLTLRLQVNEDGYRLYWKKIQLAQSEGSASQSEAMTVRALFDFQPNLAPPPPPAPKKGFLGFHTNDVLIVTSKPSPEWWKAENTATGRVGLIPSPLQRDESERKRRMSTTDSVNGSSTDVTAQSAQEALQKRERTKSIKLARRLSWKRKKKSPLAAGAPPTPEQERAKGDQDEPPVPTYELVELRAQQPNTTRPLIILGPGKEAIKDRLVQEHPDRFGICIPHTTRSQREEEQHGEDYYFVSKENMEAAMRAGHFIEAGKYNDNYYGTSITSVKDISNEGRVCILDISTSSIRRLKAVDIHPIVTYLRPASVQTILDQNPTLSDNAATQRYETALRLEKELRHFCTEVVENADFDEAYATITSTVERETTDPYWASLPEPVVA